jgi:hypothetical protein
MKLRLSQTSKTTGPVDLKAPPYATATPTPKASASPKDPPGKKADGDSSEEKLVLPFFDSAQPKHKFGAVDGTQITVTKTLSPTKARTKICHFGKAVLTVCCGKTPLQDQDSYIKHTLRLWEGDYYWIPCSYMPQFAELWMALVARKPPEATGGSSSNNQAVKALQLQNLNSTNLNNQQPLLQSQPLF